MVKVEMMYQHLNFCMGKCWVPLKRCHSNECLHRWHQDIKPANILVFSNDENSSYNCEFKIADLGLAHFKASGSELNEPSDLDANGTRAYGIMTNICEILPFD